MDSLRRVVNSKFTEAVRKGVSLDHLAFYGAGMYYVPGSVMAKTCVKGARLMYEYCDAKGIPYDRVGRYCW
jgi:hypothetical protein